MLQTEMVSMGASVNHDLSEKRRYERTTRECYARVKMFPETYGGINHGMTEDISEGGVRIRTFHKPQVDADVLVQLGCENQADLLKLKGSVVWATQSGSGDQWVVGISFSDINDHAKQRLQQLGDPVSINNPL
ncbi:hypothetical protein Thiowin_02784 [Thiorhodovibrio winogradskyi]|uniref:PilZ domain-containing protein n=1 Tax=Thiorhodovibrio winogradskyi TaxID=77007 RepID=A0ABZ0SB15_9GAMM|nr:PilZ domain-containing protein [Thiorhodovibrio winogradskyi]